VPVAKNPAIINDDKNFILSFLIVLVDQAALA
jgi:hypothetical protein